jgi:superfamily I DNA and/or RNA helicase
VPWRPGSTVTRTQEVICSSSTSGNPESVYEGPHITSDDEREACAAAPLSGGTAWVFSHADFDGSLDYLFIDEAGQVSLADALAMGTAARNLILVGDPQQLAQVLQGSHPDGVDESVLQYLLAGHATIPPDRGLFLETTYRLHPDVGGYISDEFYEGRLRSDPTCATRTTPLGTGLRFCPVEHDGCRQESSAEADRVAAEVKAISTAGVLAEEIAVVAPYNAQVNLLRELLPADVRVGTVDKFQGQEARVVLYSMASSSGEDIPRGLEFLLSRNRLNVAISRAQCLAYLVCNPGLLDVNCRTIEQMRLANALCRFVEFADHR